MKKQQNVFENPTLEKVFNLDYLPIVTLEIAVDDWNQLLSAFDDNPDKNFWIPSNFKPEFD